MHFLKMDGFQPDCRLGPNVAFLGAMPDDEQLRMTVQQLIQALSTLPPDATVLLEGDGGLSPLGALQWLPGVGGQPDEILLQPDITPD
jgi:hypothetical protein